MNTIETIRAEIERLKAELEKGNYYLDNSEQALGYEGAVLDIECFLDTLEETDRPEPYNPVYDEAYLNEKIAKATKSWKGVDVDAMLAECRGYEEKTDFPTTDVEIKEFLETHPKAEVPEKYKTPDWLFEKMEKEKSEKPNNHLEHVPEIKETGTQGMDEAANRWILSHNDGEILYVKDAFKAGAEWYADHTPLPEDTVLFNKGVEEGKRLMMEEAVECRVGSKIAGHGHMVPGIEIDFFNGEFNVGDKVRVIIIKKDNG